MRAISKNVRWTLLFLSCSSVSYFGCTTPRTSTDGSSSLPGSSSDTDTVNGEVGRMNDTTGETSVPETGAMGAGGTTDSSGMTASPGHTATPSTDTSGTTDSASGSSTGTSGTTGSASGDQSGATGYRSGTSAETDSTYGTRAGSTGMSGSTTGTTGSTAGSTGSAVVPPPSEMTPEVTTGSVAGDDTSDGLTASDQGESPQDIEITRKIRRTLTSRDELSTSAHNVKIITRNGSVVLKGPVRSASEKAAVEDAARRIAGDQSVTSQLTISAQ